MWKGEFMNNFYFQLPTKVYFGKGQIVHLGEEIKKYSDNVLLVYGGGSIKRTGLYDTIKDLCVQNDIKVYELPGVEPNPRIGTVRKGAALCKEHGIGAVLAVGGGSVIDCAKVVAAATKYDGDAWDLVLIPVCKRGIADFTVLTIAATGSEMDRGADFESETNDKLAMFLRCFIRKCHLGSEYTYSVPKGKRLPALQTLCLMLLKNILHGSKAPICRIASARRFCRRVFIMGRLLIMSLKIMRRAPT